VSLPPEFSNTSSRVFFPKPPFGYIFQGDQEYCQRGSRNTPIRVI